jgi:hypothetical protein
VKQDQHALFSRIVTLFVEGEAGRLLRTTSRTAIGASLNFRVIAPTDTRTRFVVAGTIYEHLPPPNVGL